MKSEVLLSEGALQCTGPVVSSRSRTSSKPLPVTKFSHDFGQIAMLAVDGFVHRAHIVRGNSSGKSVERSLNLRPALERLRAHQRNRLVRRKVAAVVFKSCESEGLDGAVGGVGGDHVYLVRIKSAIEQPQIHGARSGGKLESVCGAQSVQAVGALLKLIADS